MAGNLERLQAAYVAYNETKGLDPDIWSALLADHVAIASCGGPHPGIEFARCRQSKAEAIEYLSEITAGWTMIHYTPETFLEDQDRIAMFGHCAWRNKATGKVAEVPIATLWQFENGKAVSFRELFDTAAAASAATP